MTTKQTAIRIPVGLLEAIDARRDADHDRTTVIISLLTSALTGEYIKPKENTTLIISKLTKTVKSLEAAIDELSFQIKKQTQISNEITTHPIVESQLAINHNSFTVVNNEQFDDDDDDDVTEIKMIHFNYDDFIQKFKYKVPSNTLAVLLNGDSCRLAAINHNCAVIVDPRTDDTRKVPIDDVLLYRVPD